MRKHARMHRFWKTRRGLGYLRLGFAKLIRGVAADFVEKAPAAFSSYAQRFSETRFPDSGSKCGNPPVIFASYAVDDFHPGSHRYCGGEKLLNNLILQLGRKGYNARMVTLDGKQAGWLIEHAPCISLEAFHMELSKHEDTRCVTSWIDARAFLDVCRHFYYWDMELATSSDYQFPRIEESLRKDRIRNLAALNRSIQAWFVEVFSRPCSLLRTLVDDLYWKPDESRRIRNRIGYMDEGSHTFELIERVRTRCHEAKLPADFVQLGGDEREVLNGMQECEVFLVTNLGKSPVWGEGGPMTPHEAMACGTVPIAFDIIGPREVIIDGYCGRIVNRGDNVAYAEAVVEILSCPERIRQMGQRGSEVIGESHTMEKRWPEIVRFLNLKETAFSSP
jgi:glycosyltransferase involved in cell wall biosynthesis